MQQQSSKEVIEYDDVNPIPALIGGTDVGFEENGAITRAAIVVLRLPELRLVEYRVVRFATEFPYIPGYLSFREYPPLAAAWQQVEHKPPLLLVDGQGIAHPRHFGIASHLGVLLNIATIGVAKKRLYGTHAALGASAGSCVPLMAGNRHIGSVLRSKRHCNPLYISPGHRVSIVSATKWVQDCLRGYRLPEPTRWADAVASRKPLFIKWLDRNK